MKAHKSTPGALAIAALIILLATGCGPGATEPIRIANFTVPTPAAQQASREPKISIVSIWAVWCAPCVDELKTLDVLAQHYDRRTLRIVPLNIDREEKTPAARQSFEEAIKNLQSLYAGDDGAAAVRAMYADWNGTLPLNLVRLRESPHSFAIYGARSPAFWREYIRDAVGMPTRSE